MLLSALGLAWFDRSLATEVARIASTLLLVALPLYLARVQWGMLSSLRRSGTLEELLSCGPSARSCADVLAAHSLQELLRTGLVALPVLLLAGCWQGVPALLGLTLLGSYLACLPDGVSRSWRQALGAVPAGLLAGGLFAAALFTGPVGAFLTLCLLVACAREAAVRGLTRAVGSVRASAVRKRRRPGRLWGENPIAAREQCRESPTGYWFWKLAVLGGMLYWAGSVLYCTISPNLLRYPLPNLRYPVLPWGHCEPTVAFWGGLAAFGAVAFLRGAHRTLGAVVGEREQGTWETLTQTGLTVTAFLRGWLQVGSQTLLLEAIPLTLLAGVVAALLDGIHLWQVLLAGLTLALLAVTGPALGLALSACSNSRREATGRLLAAVVLGVLLWMLAWWVTAAFLGLVGTAGLVDAGQLGWALQTIVPFLTLDVLCMLALRQSLRAARANLSLAPERRRQHALERWGLAPVGAVLFASATLVLYSEAGLFVALGTALLYSLPGWLTGFLVEWWWAPVLGRWRGQVKGVALTAGLGAGLGVAAAYAPDAVAWLFAWLQLLRGGGLPDSPVYVHVTPMLAPALGFLLGAARGCCELSAAPRRRGSFIVRSLPIAVFLVAWRCYAPPLTEPVPEAHVVHPCPSLPDSQLELWPLPPNPACRAWPELPAEALEFARKVPSQCREQSFAITPSQDPRLTALTALAVWQVQHGQVDAALQTALCGVKLDARRAGTERFTLDDPYALACTILLSVKLTSAQREAFVARLDELARAPWSQEVYLELDGTLRSHLRGSLYEAQHARLANEWTRCRSYLEQLHEPPPECSDRWLQVPRNWGGYLQIHRRDLLRLEGLRLLAEGGRPRWTHPDDAVSLADGLLLARCGGDLQVLYRRPLAGN